MASATKPASSSGVKPTIDVKSLTFKFPDGSQGLTDVNLHLPSKSRTLLIGANGAGKTTLLRLLSGKRMSPPGTVHIGGIDPFKDGVEETTYLGTEWVLNPIVRTDIDVPTLLKSIGGDAYPERRDELVSILDIDTTWRMHQVSDGERRRVQIAMGLIKPWRVLLLDEITVDLDLLARTGFLDFLRRETETRDCTLVYATHIFDSLSDWPTHLVHMSLGRIKQQGTMDHFTKETGGVNRAGNSPLGALVLEWLKADLKERGPRRSGNSEGKAHAAQQEIGGYGLEKRPE